MFVAGPICSSRRRCDRIAANVVSLGGVSVIRALFEWWLERLSELQPAWLRRRISMPTDGLIITPIGPLDRGPETVSIVVRRGGAETEFGEFKTSNPQLESLPGIGNMPAILRLMRADVLEKNIELPLAAQSELGQVLEFEMDRQTPFSAEELYWDHHIEAVDRRRGRLTVRLAMALRRNVDPFLDVLKRSGIAPTRIEVLGDLSAGSLISIEPGYARHPLSRRLVWTATLSCLLLAIGAAAIPFVRQSVALAQLDREIADARPAAADVEKLRQKIDRVSSNADFVAGERNKAARALDTLAALTRLLPDDTYLTGLELRQKKLTMTGRSAGAARLIAALAADPLFRDPVFSAPVTRLEASQGEVFSIKADVE
jgi:general secretion pathway protein L